jgi:hypothetical protein
MIVVEAGHAHVMKFLSLSLQVTLGENSGDEDFIIFLKIND